MGQLKFQIHGMASLTGQTLLPKEGERVVKGVYGNIFSSVHAMNLSHTIDIEGGGWTRNTHIAQAETFCTIRVTLILEIIIHLCVVFVKCVCIILACRHF